MRFVGLFVAILALGAGAQQQQGNKVIKAIMERSHKGRDNIASEVRNGRGTEADVKKLLEEYKLIAAQKPVLGDAKSWKSRTDAVMAALNDLIAKKPGAVERVHAATECRGCHEAHRPGGNK
jgi:hypothetical protein